MKVVLFVVLVNQVGRLGVNSYRVRDTRERKGSASCRRHSRAKEAVSCHGTRERKAKGKLHCVGDTRQQRKRKETKTTPFDKPPLSANFRLYILPRTKANPKPLPRVILCRKRN